MKWCSKGQHFVDLVGFNKSAKRPDGLAFACRSCHSQYGKTDAAKAKRRAFRATNAERINKGLREWYHTKCDKRQHYQRSREWIKNNSDKYKEWMRLNYEANKTERILKGRSRYVAKRDEILESQKAYYRNNKQRYQVATRRYKTRRKNAAGHFTFEQWQEKLCYHGHRCYLCKDPLTDKKIHVEHRIPISRGGSNWIANIAPACDSCNLRKNNKTEVEFKKRLGLGA